MEEPDAGDYLREISPGMFAALNRGKRSVALDLKTAGGAAQLAALCAQADVVIESFRPGVLERLVAAAVAGAADRLPHLGIRAGRAGGLRDRAGHDIGYVALAGVLARNRALPAVQLADLFGGAQQRGHRACWPRCTSAGAPAAGRVVDVSMTHGVTGLLLPRLGALPTRPPTRSTARGPAIASYACKDGGLYALGALEPKFWQRFCAALGGRSGPIAPSTRR